MLFFQRLPAPWNKVPAAVLTLPSSSCLGGGFWSHNHAGGDVIHLCFTAYWRCKRCGLWGGGSAVQWTIFRRWGLAAFSSFDPEKPKEKHLGATDLNGFCRWMKQWSSNLVKMWFFFFALPDINEWLIIFTCCTKEYSVETDYVGV